MKFYQIAQVQHTQPIVDKSQIETTSITLGGIIFICTLITGIYAVVKGIAEISTQANQLKNDFERSDLIINNKIDIFSEKIDRAMNIIDDHKSTVNKKVYQLESRVQDVELFLAKQGEFYVRRVNLIEDDQPSGLFK